MLNLSLQRFRSTEGDMNKDKYGDEIALAAQIIAKQSPGISIQNIESIIIQMALEISKSQGKAITGQTIFEVANQIKQNPNGILTQAIIQLVKQDTHDGGKTGQTVKVIQKVVQAGKEGEERAIYQNQQHSNNKPNLVSPIPVPAPTPTQEPTGMSVPISPQPQLGPLDTLLVYGGRFIIDYALGPGVAETIDTVAETVIAAAPAISRAVAQLTASDLVLRTANNAGPSQAIQTLNDLQIDTKSNPLGSPFLET